MTEQTVAIRCAHLVSSARVFTHNFRELIKAGMTPDQIQALEGMPPSGVYKQMLRDLAWQKTPSCSLEELLTEGDSVNPAPAPTAPMLVVANPPAPAPPVTGIRHIKGDPKLVLPAIISALRTKPDQTTEELHAMLVQAGYLEPGEESCASFDAKLKGLRKIHVVEEHYKWRLARKDEVCTALDVLRCIQQIQTFSLDSLRDTPALRFRFPGMKPGKLKEAYLQSILHHFTVRLSLLMRTPDGDYARNLQFDWPGLDNQINAYTARTPLAASKAKAAEELRKIIPARFWERCQYVYT